jgi:NAD(P)-dependent dehydrogenase (short-subunit alcohol dehydrogenase family)
MSTWKNKVVAVTGGSAGLGLVIARAFLARGAIVALVARDEGRLAAAQEALGSDRVLTVAADVTDEDMAAAAMRRVVEAAGGMDVLVNNVGKSVRIDLLKTRLDDYRQFMEVNFLSAVSCTYAALDALKKSSGHVVNIGSLSSRTAWPFLAPYTTSKFALAAFTHHLRLEGPSNVHYMLVCPGPIKRDDAGERYDDQARHLPQQAREPAAGARVRGMEPARLAEKIVWGCERRKLEWMPFRYRLVLMANALSPRLGDWYLRRKMKK